VNGLETALRGRRDAGHPLLVPYLSAGVGADWTDHARAWADAGADAIEIGLPFSDPMLDGTPVQQASQRALDRGTTVRSALEAVAGLSIGVPLVAMTYTNLVMRPGRAQFCRWLAEAGFGGLIVVDTPYAEGESLTRAAAEHRIDLVRMLAPSTSADRVRQIVQPATGFVYAATVMGTTGERDGLPAEAGELVARVRPHTTLPVLLGFGIATAADAARAAVVADGVVVGSALMRRVLAGAGPGETAAVVATLRAALDSSGTARAGAAVAVPPAR